MELRHIRYFMAVAQELSFTRAANILCIAQPPLSRQIRDLEEELGAQLFIRKPHSLMLTEAGVRFQQYAEQILHLADQSIQDIREMSTGLQGTLFLATVEGQGPEMIAGWMSEFHKLHPAVKFDLWNGNSDDVAARLRSGLCDLALVVAPFDESTYEGMKVYEEPWIAMIPNSCPLAQKEGDTVEPIDLVPYDLIIPSKQSRLYTITSWFTKYGVEPKILCRMSHMLNASKLTEKGMGIAIYPAAVSNYTKPENNVTIKRLINPESNAQYHLIKNRSRELSVLAKTFYDFVIETID